jgi:signal transduction histidine kinase
MQKHLFEKFYQTANQDHRNKKGIGLGLAISKQIVEAHQGRIWLERSSAYQETVFSIEIPISDT